MKKILGLLTVLMFLNGCAESIALLGPVSTGASGGKIAKSAVSSAVSLGVKQTTGKSPSEHAMSYIKENNPQNKKERCVYFLEFSDTATCAAIKKQLADTRKKIFNTSKIQNLSTK